MDTTFPFTFADAAAIVSPVVRRALAADRDGSLAKFIARPRPVAAPAVTIIPGKLYTLPCGAHPMTFDRALCVKVESLIHDRTGVFAVLDVTDPMTGKPAEILASKLRD